MKIFLDTSAIIALYNADDSNHESAASIMDAIRQGHIPLTRFYTTDYVLDEVLTFISRTIGSHTLAVSVGEALLTSPFTTIQHVDDELFGKAWEMFKGHKGLSFTDCASFQTMKENDINQAFSYDRHFKTAGFKAINQQFTDRL